MSSLSFKSGLVTKDQLHETSVTDEEVNRVSDLLSRKEHPLTGFEIHLIKALKNEALPLSPKEKALVKAMELRMLESSDAFDSDEYVYEISADELAENEAILKEMWSDTDDITRSDEDGWLYED